MKHIEVKMVYDDYPREAPDLDGDLEIYSHGLNSQYRSDGYVPYSDWIGSYLAISPPQEIRNHALKVFRYANNRNILRWVSRQSV